MSPDRTAHDFGVVGQGETLGAAFSVTNRYPMPIELRDVQTSCGCQAAHVSQKHLAPGEATTITFKWETRARRGTITDTAWLVHMRPDTEQLGRLPLQLKATVQPDLLLDPSVCEFRLGHAEVVRLRVTPGRVAGFAVHEAHCNATPFQARWDGGRSEIEIRYTPAGETDGGPDLWAALVTDAPHEPYLRIPIRVTRTGRGAPTGGDPSRAEGERP